MFSPTTMSETLLVHAPNRLIYEQWLRDYGLALSNVQFELILHSEDVQACRGFIKGSTFYTIVDREDSEDRGWVDSDVEKAMRSRYRYAPQEAIERAIVKSGWIVSPSPS